MFSVIPNKNNASFWQDIYYLILETNGGFSFNKNLLNATVLKDFLFSINAQLQNDVDFNEAKWDIFLSCCSWEKKLFIQAAYIQSVSLTIHSISELTFQIFQRSISCIYTCFSENLESNNDITVVGF